MIILFAPAKTLKSAKALSESASFPFEEVTKGILSHIRGCNPTQLMNSLQVSIHQIDEIYQTYQTFDSLPFYHAFELLDGVAYKTLDYLHLQAKAKAFINQRVYVIDALFGIFQPNTPIKPYYLDMGFKGLNLRSLWRPIVNEWLQQMIEKNEEILSLTSSEYRSVLPSSAPIYEVIFLDCKNGVCKANSVFSKQMRGKLLRYIVTHQLSTIEQLPLVFDLYHLEIEGRNLIYKRFL